MDLFIAEQVNEVNRPGGNILEKGPVLKCLEWHFKMGEDSERRSIFQSRSQPFATCLRLGLITTLTCVRRIASRLRPHVEQPISREYQVLETE